MKLLHLTHSMNPAYGGVSACIASLVTALSDLGHHSIIVSLDGAGEAFVQESTLPLVALGPGKYGFGFCPALSHWLTSNGSRFDAIIVHGLWQYHGLAARLYRTRTADSPPYYVFPHGMLDPWFKRRYPLKHLKKLLYWWVAERRVLRDANVVLFSCQKEMALGRATYPLAGYQEAIVGLGTPAPHLSSRQASMVFASHLSVVKDRPYWLFLGRIHEKKGVDLLIDAYALLCSQGLSLPHLVVAGPSSDRDYLSALIARATRTCPTNSVVWPGMLSGDDKWGAVAGAEVFILPSHQENFGLAVTEALSCGTPVLVSNQVNIASEIADAGAGFAAPDSLAGTLEIMRKWLALDTTGRDRMRAFARQAFADSFDIQKTAHDLVTTLTSTHSLALLS